MLTAPTGSSFTVRRIWLVADDYGISPAVNGAIRDLIARGRLNATSVMVVAPSFSRLEALSLSELNVGSPRVAIGLHLTLTGPFRSLTTKFATVRDGAFPPLAKLLRMSIFRQLDYAALSQEIAAQIENFSALFGRPPDFIDGHQHVHLFPQIRNAVLEQVKRLAPQAWVRQCAGAALLRAWDRKGLVIDLFSRRLRRHARALGVATNPAFAGTYAFRPRADFAALFPRFLKDLPDGGVVMCHPGLVDPELARLDPLTKLRELEYAYLGGENFLQALARHHVVLARPDM